MRFSIFRGLIILVLLVGVAGIAAGQNIQLGVNLGTSIIPWTYTADDNFTAAFFNDCSLSDTYIPKTFGGSIYLTYPGFMLRVALNHGQTRSNIDSHIPNNGFSYTAQNGLETNVQIENLNYEMKTRVIGFSASTALLFPFSMGRNRILSIYPGVGGGYYKYQFSGEWNVKDEEIDHNGISTVYTAKGDYEKASISGVAQFFLIGIDVKAGSRLHFFFETSKMGLSMLRQVRELEYHVYEPDITGTKYTKTFQKKIGEIKSDFNAKSGLSDIGFLFGVKMSI